MIKKSGLMCLAALLVNLIPCFSQDYPLVYRNEEFGFEIRFSKAWQGVKVFKKLIFCEANFEAPTFYVMLPTKSSNWSSDLEGYAGIFAITAYTYKKWEKVQATEYEMYEPIEYVRNNKYIFTYSHSHASPEDLYDMFANNEYTFSVFDLDRNTAVDDSPPFYTPTINNLRLREGPNLDSKTIRLLRLGEKLEVTARAHSQKIDDVRGTWVRVKTQSGEVGWCFDAYLKKW
jgi:hypothetical protein